MKSVVFLFLAIHLVLTSKVVAAQEAAWSVRIDSPFAGPLWRLATSGDESLLAVSSADETVTTWALDLEMARSRIALPRRAALNYRARGLAIHPVTGLIAVSSPPVERSITSGPRGARISIRSHVDGSLDQQIEASLPTRPQALAFSPDGEWLAAVLSEGCGLRVWAVGSWSPVFADDEQHGGCGTSDAAADTTELRFVAGSPLALLTAGASGIRRYEVNDGAYVRTAFRAPDDSLQRPDGLAISGNRRFVAVGDRRVHNPQQPLQLRVTILDTETLEVAADPLVLSSNDYFYEASDTPVSRQMRISRVTWQDDLITAGGVVPCRDVADYSRIVGVTRPSFRSNCLVRWSRGDKSGPDFVPVGDDAVIDMLSLPGRGALAVATRNAITLFSPDGSLWVDDYGEVLEEISPFADFRQRYGRGGALLAFNLSDDGQRLFFQQYGDQAGLAFDVSNLALTQMAQAEPDLRPPDIDNRLFGEQQQWLNSRQANFADDKLLQENDVLRAVSGFDNGRYAFVGTADTVQVVDMSSRAVLCRLRVTSEAFRVNVARQQRIAVVGHADGTLRWYFINLQSEEGCRLEERLAVNVRRALKDPGIWTWHAWVANTGRYASDAQADPDMTWQRTLEDGTVDLVDFTDVSELYDRTAITEALLPITRIEGPSLEDLAEQEVKQDRAVSISVLSPRNKRARLSKSNVNLNLMVKGEGPWPRKLDIRVDRKISVEKIVAGRTYAAGEPIDVERPGLLKVNISLPERVRRRRGGFRLCFLEDDRVLNKCGDTLTWSGNTVPRPKPKLWAVLAGLSDYSKSRLGSLKYAQNDALDLARLLVDDHTDSLTNPGTSDYSGLHVDLIVAPTTQDARDEIAELSSSPFVTVHDQPGTSAIMSALQTIADRDRNEELADDLVLLSYSGHGTSALGQRGEDTLLLDPAWRGASSSPNATASSVPIRNLIDTLSRISAEQIVLIDACRNLSKDTISAIDPALENTRLEKRANPAHFVFSANVGQYSHESPDFAFSSHRKDGANSGGKPNGNGIFSYSILRALTDPDADIFKSKASRDRIDVNEVEEYLRNFFDDSLDRNLEQESKLLKIIKEQQPVWTPSGGHGRSVNERTILRTLRP